MRFQFILSELFIGLRRNLSMSVSVILVTFVSLAFVGSAALLQTQVAKLEADWYGQVEISVFLCPMDSPERACAAGEVTPEQIRDVEALFVSPELDPLIEEVYFETKEDAFESFERRFGDDPRWASVTVDDMQQSFRIKLADPEQFEVVADVLSGRPGVEDVEDQREYFETVFQVLRVLTFLSVGVGVVMLVAAVLLITTTIRLSALSRRRETGIMRLVGASTFFIQLPFMLEGALAATIGAALAGGALWFGVSQVTSEVVAGADAGLLAGIDLVGTGDVLGVLPGLVLIAIAVAGVSSLVTLSRYTRV